MKKPISISELRSNIYLLMGHVARSGEPLFIERDGVLLRVARVSTQKSLRKRRTNIFARIKAAQLTPILRGDPDSLVGVSWASEWEPDDPS